MRVLLVLLSALLLTTPAWAVPFTVDPSTRTIETSKLKIQFAMDCPERVLGLWYKPYSTTAAINGEALPWEFSGQSIQGLWVGQGWTFSQSVVSQSWTVLRQNATQLVLRINSQSTWNNQLQPEVRTDYTFFADSACYQIQRTIFYSRINETTSLQPYVLRITLGLVSGVRFRNAASVIQTGGLCGSGCYTGDWDGRWSQVYGAGFVATTLYAPESPRPINVMDDYDSYSNAGWTSPYTPSLSFTTDQTYRMLYHFSTYPSDIALADSVYTFFANLPVSTAGVGAATPGLRLAVSPNPVRATATIAFTLPEAVPAEVVVFDLAGRQVARLASGVLDAGEHQLRWDGHAGAARARAGLYVVRLRTPQASITRKLLLTP